MAAVMILGGLFGAYLLGLGLADAWQRVRDSQAADARRRIRRAIRAAEWNPPERRETWRTPTR